MLFGIVLDVWDYFFIMLIVSLGLSGLTTYLKPRDRARLRRIEAKLDLLLKHAGVTYAPHAAVPPDVLEAIQRGDKIGAIKLYREETGTSLAEAKEYVEDLIASQPKT